MSHAAGFERRDNLEIPSLSIIALDEAGYTCCTTKEGTRLGSPPGTVKPEMEQLFSYAEDCLQIARIFEAALD